MRARLTASLTSVADWLVLLYGWRRALVALLAGAFATLALPPVFALPVLLVSFPVLALLLDGADADPPGRGRWRWLFGRAGFFATGFWFGFGWFAAGLSWISESLLVEAARHAWLIPFALTLIPAGLALFTGAACALAGRFWTGGPWRLVALAASLAGFEWLRGVVLSGFPWNGFHLPLAAHEVLLQGFALGGAGVASLVVLLVALAPAALWPAEGARRRGLPMVVLACVLALVWTGGGAARLALAPPDRDSGVTVRIVQPNIAQRDKWDAALRDQHFASLVDLTRQTGAGDDLGLLAATHVIWPESAFPFLLAQRPDALVTLGEMLPLGTSLIAGALRAEPRGGERVFTNAVFAFNDRGEIIDAYDKALLVPFGEMLPLGGLVDRLGLRPIVRAPAGFVPGSGPGILETPGAPPALALVCYEAIFARYVRQGVRALDPGFLVNVTNDAWFGSSAGPHQHFHQARLRAVETGRALVRAANTGISAVVDAHGRVVGSLPVDRRGVLSARVQAPLTETPYLKWGDAPFGATLVLVLFLSIYHQHRIVRRASSSV